MLIQQPFPFCPYKSKLLTAKTKKALQTFVCGLCFVARGRVAQPAASRFLKGMLYKSKALCSLRSHSSFSLHDLSSKLEAMHEKSPSDFVCGLCFVARGRIELPTS